MTSRLMSRHATAWMSDGWYRLAWFAWPSSAALLAALLSLAGSATPKAPPMPSGWVHPLNAQSMSRALGTLRDRAKTDAEAERLLRQRAEHGEAIAQFYLATLLDPLLDHAKSSPERTSEAIDWYRKSAENGDTTAAANLGILRARNLPGQPADFTDAFRWLEQAAPTQPSAQRELGQLYRLGHGVPVDIGKGVDLLRSAAERGDPMANVILADAYDRGTDGLAKDPHQAVLLFQQAAVKGNIYAQRQLGVHLRAGDGVESDPVKAMDWFRRAARAGDAFSQAQLGQATPGSPPSPHP